ncbi:MAG: DUF262 domain-containing protein [Ardenticatenales bacterium]|nr:DUF262 domain-containing protein [Ardenticatenales bacterium]
MAIHESLPPGWKVVQFGDVVQEITTHERNPLGAGLTRYVGLDHLDTGSLRIKRWGEIENGITFTKQFKAGQVLFGKRRVYQRKAAVADFDGLCSSDILVFEADPTRLLPELLPFVVHTDAFFQYALNTSAGSLSPRTKWRDLATFHFPLPPLERQRELVDLFQGFEDALAATEESLAAAIAVERSILFELLEPRIGWKSCRLDTLAEVNGGRQRAPSKMTGLHTTPYLRAANVKLGQIDFSDVLEMDFTPEERLKYTLLPGDILLVEGNASIENVGACAIYTEDMPKNHCFQNTLIRVRILNENLFSPNFLYHYLSGLYQKGILAKLANGTSIKHLGSTRLATVDIHIPASIKEQELIANVLADVIRQTQTFDSHKSHLESLKSHTLNTLLSGERDLLRHQTLPAALPEPPPTTSEEPHPMEEIEQVEGLDIPKDDLGEYPIDSLLIRTEQRTIFDVLRRIKADQYILNPDFQRDFVWPQEKQVRLIESTLMRIPLPVFYLAERDDGKIIVVDGLQRLTTFHRFHENEFSLGGLAESNSELNKKFFKDLPPRLQTRFEDTNLIMYLIDSKVPERARLDIFERVNSGVPLSRQQMRNSLYMGEATRWLREQAISEWFQRATGGSLSSKTMRDREAINRFCGFWLLGRDKYKGDMDQFLADTLEQMNKLEPTPLRELAQHFESSMKNNFMVFEQHAFRKHSPESTSRSVINIALFDVFSVQLALYPEAWVRDQKDEIHAIFYELMQNQTFADSISLSTNDLRRVRDRFQLVDEAFTRRFPDADRIDA